MSPDLRLAADCARCVGLCCVAPAFARSADFAVDKPAGRPCPNLGADHRCDVHDRLRPSGFPGCVAYDCFGAGQQVTQVTYRQRGIEPDWRGDARVAAELFAAFEAMRDLHELLWYLAAALDLPGAAAVHGDLRALRDEVEAHTAGDGPALAAIDRPALRRRAHLLLLAASEAVRGPTPAGRDLTGRDLLGERLAGRDLRRAQVLGACLIGADLAGADLRGADLRSADLRGADLRGTRLDGALFVIQAQVESATGDAATTLPGTVRRPDHWQV